MTDYCTGTIKAAGRDHLPIRLTGLSDKFVASSAVAYALWGSGGGPTGGRYRS